MTPAVPAAAKTFLVLGDTGLLGQALMARGREFGFAMRGASRHSPDFCLDALDPIALATALDQISPDCVINAAGLINVDLCEQQPSQAYLANARLPGLLAAACQVRDIQLVQISTDHFFSGDGTKAHDENAPVRLVNEYARTKYAGECLALTYPKTLVLRTNIVGFRGWEKAPTFIEWLLDALEKEAPIQLFDDFYTSSLDTAQFTALVFELLDQPIYGRLNLACREGASKLQFAETLAKACGLSTSACRRASIRGLAGTPRADSLVLDVTAAEKLLGRPLPDLDAVIQSLSREYLERQEKGVCVTPR